jgi:uncharacterized membrane protein YphA (DoxX/SURF4 family)
MRENNKALNISLIVIRVIVGLLFIFSGLVKANDPLGLSYKMQEFFEVWGVSYFNDYTLFMALTMNTFEIVAGVAVLLGWRMKFFSWLLLLLIIFFTFLTGYALLSGKIKTCGCFGDCIPLSPLQSFIKDIILLILIAVIFRFRYIIKPFLSSATNGSIIVATTFFCIVLQWYVLKHLPIVDCLPYKVGNNITEKMKVPEGAVPDSFAINFKYQKEGKIVQFDMDHFPDDFNDSTYQFIERTQKLIREGSAHAAITDFGLSSLSGTDTTQAILSQDNYYVLFFLKDLASAKKRWEDNLPPVLEQCKQRKIPFFVVSAVADLAKAHFEEIPNIDTTPVHYLKCDATVIKTAARENPTYIIMKQANIYGKYAAADYKKAVNQLKTLK